MRLINARWGKMRHKLAAARQIKSAYLEHDAICTQLSPVLITQIWAYEVIHLLEELTH